MRPGQIIDNRFRLGDQIGSGGMGQVFRGEDLQTGEVVAIKFLHAHSAFDQMATARFSREASVIAAISHPAIVRFLAHGRDADGRVFIVMEWLDGSTLKHRLQSQGLTLSEALAIGIQIAGALGEVHRADLVHRDIKPSNILLTGPGGSAVKLIDFGVAHRNEERKLTSTGMRLGTPGYMSPEQVRGDRDVDARADVFALGCVLHECFTGRMAFYATDESAALAKILMVNPPPLRTICNEASLELELLLRRMMDKLPHRRPANGDEVAAELRAIAPVDRSLRRPTSLPEAPTRVVPIAESLKEASANTGPRTFIVLITDESGDDADLAVEGQRNSALKSLADQYGADLHLLGCGMTAIIIQGGVEDVLREAFRAMDCARAVQQFSPELPVALACDEGISAGDSLESAIDRAFFVLSAAALDTGEDSGGTVALDATMTSVLEKHVELRRGRVCHYVSSVRLNE